MPKRPHVLLFFFSLLIVFAVGVFVAVRPEKVQAGSDTPGGTSAVTGAPSRQTDIGQIVKPIGIQEKAVIVGNTTGQGSLPVLADGMSTAIKSSIVLDLIGGSTEYQKSIAQSSVLDSLGKATAMTFERPATTQMAVADLMQTAGFGGIVQPAYAQGFGFSALNPILTTWKIFRNMAYFFYVIIFLAIGMMIMFRKQMGSQAAVNAQQALPTIIISLIAVTFSYAIAGILIDAMYLVMLFIVSIFQSQFSTPLQDLALNNNIFGVGVKIWQMGAAGTGMDAISELVKNAFSSTVVGGTVSGVLGWLGGLTFALVFSLALVFSIFRLFFELLKTYISIVIAIVLSPLALMLGAIPGNKAFQSWLKTMIANLAVFPAVLILIILGLVLSGTNTTNANTSLTGGGWVAPYLFGQGQADVIRAIIGLAIILIMPELVTQVKKVLGGGGGIFEQFGSNFLTALGRGWKGDEIIPGLAMSNTSKWPGGGLTGSNAVKKAGVIAGAGAGGLATLGWRGIPGAARELGRAEPDTGRALQRLGGSFKSGFLTTGGQLASALKEDQIFHEQREHEEHLAKAREELNKAAAGGLKK